MAINLDRIFQLLSRVGGKMFVEKDNQTYVVMPVEDFEALIDTQQKVEELTEEELIDKINADIAEWRMSQSDELDSVAYLSQENAKISDNIGTSEDEYYLEPVD